MTVVIKRRKAPPLPRATVYVREVCIDDMPEEASLEYEPFNILQQKIEALMELTGGTERECERMVLGML